ncbi:hypothetical protein FE839_05705 [Klebsiella indica]|uniref:Virulence factor MviN n=1 Tax=Klebsiella indica TaxID=2582917 RepID=A0A5R9LKV0_9ENTR|nr:lipid II flippase MurJ [Klebsiella indica]TLV21528.1 hypothetical protein FE839_05705 [Klebsiella indica]
MKKNILQLFSGNVLSKVLGLAREICLSRFFGTGEINASYRIAQTGTLVPINFLTSDSLNSAFIPLYKKYLSEDKNRADSFKWLMYLFFVIISLLVSFFIVFYSDFWITILAPGVKPSTALIAKNLLSIMAICTPFYLCSAIVNYVSMAHDDFVPMSMRAIFQNLGMLFGVFLAYFLNNYVYLAWGFTGSYIIFCAWAFCRKNRQNLFSFPEEINFSDIKIVAKEFAYLMRPLIFLPFILQGNIALERALSSLISIDAISGLDYARFITDTVNFFIAIPVAFAGLSNWSASNIKDTKINLKNIYRILLVFGGGISLYIYFFSNEIVTLLFKHGAFDDKSVFITTNYLKGMCIGLWAQVIGYIFLKALNAHLLNKKVLIVISVSVLTNILWNLLVFRHLGAFGIGIGASLNGFVVFILSACYIGILKDIIKPTIIYLTGIVIYVIVYYIMGGYFDVESQVDILFKLLINGICMFVFLFFWIIFFKEYRDVLLNVLSGVIAKINRKS